MTPREIALRQRAIEAERKTEKLRAHYETQIDQMREAQAKRANPTTKTIVHRVFDSYTESQLRSMEADIRRRAGDIWRCQVVELRNEIEALRARVDAGMYRRTQMMWLLGIIVRCEDDESMSDDEHDRLMDEVIKRARSILSVERLARANRRPL
jgi:hypothetical protein